jgi:hypothetical protein
VNARRPRFVSRNMDRGDGTASGEPAQPEGRRGLRRRLGIALTGLAVLLLWLVLELPTDARLTAPGLLRIPVEGVVLAALLLALPARATRTARGISVAAGLLLAVAVLLEVADLGFYQVLDRPAHVITDGALLGGGLDFVQQSYGSPAGIAAAVLAAVLVVATVVGITVLVVRLGAVLRRHRRAGTGVVAVLAAGWGVLAVTGSAIVPGQPVAARSVVTTAGQQWARAAQDLRDGAAYQQQLSAARGGGSGGVLSALAGKNVIFAFVESYGRSALEDPGLSPGVTAVVDAGNRDLVAAGYGARSGWLTSPTFGGGSWLAHSTLLSGTWVDGQTRYAELLRSSFPTLVTDFRSHGWRAVATMPGTRADWPQGKFYGYDEIYTAPDLGYHGPTFSWSPMPDEFVLSRLQHLELAGRHTAPLMATIELTSSHTPWAPLPVSVPWEDVGDGAVFDPMPAQGKQSATVWQDPQQIRAEYARSIQYSVSTVLTFLQHYGGDNTVLVMLGDHQPAKIVTGEGASHDVPITIVTKDRSLLDRLSGWNWSESIHPAHAAPVWPMDAFRAHFLAAFGAPGR